MGTFGWKGIWACSMRVDHFEILAEEQSMEEFLRGFLPRLLAGKASFKVHTHQGKGDLLTKLPNRLKGYSQMVPETWRIIVVIDRDVENCLELKRRMEVSAAGVPLRVVKLIAGEELEAWYFGDWEAVRRVYPRVTASIPEKSAYRNVDAIAGERGRHLSASFRRSDISGAACAKWRSLGNWEKLSIRIAILLRVSGVFAMRFWMP